LKGPTDAQFPIKEFPNPLPVTYVCKQRHRSTVPYASARSDREYWGRLVESAVGAYLVNSTRGTKAEVFYWLERNQEVDFVLRSGNDLAALEVKSGRMRLHRPGIDAFSKIFRPKRQFMIGQEGIALEEFLTIPVDRWLS
jgi:predicted AAA+ superfamily ATPase